MKKEDLLKDINLNVREVEAFGSTVKVRNLTIKEMIDATAYEGSDQILLMVSYALVEPKLTLEELGSLDSSKLADLTKLIAEISPDN